MRVGGKGPAVVLLHGFGDTGDMWAPLAAVLAKDHTVIVPDLRGMGLSAHPDTGYTKKNQAADIAGVMDALKIQKADLVTHDIGNMVGYALAAQYPDAHYALGRDRCAAARHRRLGRISCTVRCCGTSTSAAPTKSVWWRAASASISTASITSCRRDPKKIDEATREHYAALYAKPHAMHDAFEQFGAFSQDAIDNKALLAKGGKLTMPVLGVGRGEVIRRRDGRNLRFVATNVDEAASFRTPVTGSWRKTRRRRLS